MLRFLSFFFFRVSSRSDGSSNEAYVRPTTPPFALVLSEDESESRRTIRLDGGKGKGGRLEQWAGAPPDASAAACVAAAAGETAAASGSLEHRESSQEDRRGETAAGEGGDGDGEGEGEGDEQRLQDEVYLYSLEKGFLMLRPDLRRKHGIVTANVTVSAHDPCLGGRVVQVIDRFLRHGAMTFVFSLVCLSTT